MNLQAMSKDELQELSMVEIAYSIMKEEHNPYDYYDLLKKVAEVKEMSEEEVNLRIANLYTEMNIDGRFHSLGDNRWGLKSWYPLEQAEEEITTPIPKRKKAKASADDVDVLDEDFDDYDDEYEDLEDELDVISKDDDEADDEFEDKDDLDLVDEESPDLELEEEE